MKVLLTKPFFESDIEYIKSGLIEGIELIFPQDYKTESIVSASSEVEVLFGGLINKEILDSAQKVKLIQIPWTGVDNTLS